MKTSRRAWSVAGLSSSAAVVAAAGGASWYYASRLTQPPGAIEIDEPEPHDVVRVRSVTNDRVVLTGPDADRAGVWGLDPGDGSYARIRDVLRVDTERVAPVGDRSEDAVTPTERLVTRRLEPVVGTLRADTTALLDGYAYPPDGTLLTPDATEIMYESGVGPAPAWFLPGTSDTWLIAVHGRAADRREAFRLAPTAVALGLPVMSIAYRNDREAPPSPDHRSHLGHSEWEDVEAAIDHALMHGARSVILVGYSMGGALVMGCLRRSSRAGVVKGKILEAPVLDWGPVVRRAALARGLPAAVLPALLPATMAIARARVGIDFDQLRSDPAAMRHPTLLIHGDADNTVPVELSDALAQARPDIVTYLRVPGADHVRAWNADPELYDMSVRCFLEAIA